MCRLIILGVKQEQDNMEQLLKEVVASECFEPLSPEDVLPAETRSFFRKNDGVSFEEAFSLLCRLHKLSGKEPLPRPVFSPEIASRFNFSLRKARLLERRMDQKLTEISELKRLVERFEHMRRHLRMLRYLDVDFEDLISLEGFSIKFGRILSMYFDRLIESVNDAPILVMDIEKERELRWIMVFTLPRMQKEAESILQSVGFEEHTLPRAMLKGSVEEVYFRVSDEIKKLYLEIERKKIELREIFYKNRTFIYQFLDHLYVLRSVYHLQEKVGFSESLFALSGWVPEREKKKIQSFLEQEEKVLVVEEQPDVREVLEEKVPVRLANLSFFRPFESLVKMYGLPSYWEIDPTPVVALTFLFMFGFMFGDVGHGAILALAGFFYYLKKHSDLGWVFGWAGVSSIVFGFLYGSFLGFEDLLPALWVRPIEEISYLMGVSVAIGVVLLALGMGLGMLNLVRAGQWRKFFLGSSGLAAFAFYWLGVWLAFSYFRYGKLPQPVNLWLGALVALLVVIYLHEVFETSPQKRKEKAVESTFVLFDELIRFLSNTLSFIRLAAFAINHAGIFLAFLSIAQMVQGGAFSGISRVLIIVFGNILILGLEGLVVFIQALRLEFYELFSRFFTGEGKPFQPVTFGKISTERR